MLNRPYTKISIANVKNDNSKKSVSISLDVFFFSKKKKSSLKAF